jgi:hypothetical protein
LKRLGALASLALVSIAIGCGDDSSTAPGPEVIRAAFSVSPDNGTVLTEFTFNTRGSTAPEGALEFRWDWENDGVWDTGWSGTTKAYHRYSLYGGDGADTIEVRLEARAGGEADTTVGRVFIDARHGRHLDAVTLELGSPRVIGNDGTHIWIASWGTIGTAYKLDHTTGHAYLSIATPDPWPSGITWAGSELWITGNKKACRVDPSDGKVISQFPAVYSAQAGGLAWDGETFYHGSFMGPGDGDGMIHTYNIVWTHQDSFPAPRGSVEPTGLAFDGEYLWATVSSVDSVYVLDPADGGIIRTFELEHLAGDITLFEDHLWALCYFEHTAERMLVRAVP